MKVSVVIPVYNPGDFLEPLIASLSAQTMPQTDFEAVFVDDGSTDSSATRLAQLVADRSNVHVISQENSGWPGRPRNVGTDAAVGEYVFYCDQDDWLGESALERLYEMAIRTAADIVIGKMTGHKRGVPTELFRRTVERAIEPDVPLTRSLTPHKLFRRAFLNEHDLRFPEGRRRLEDHVFVVRGLLLADVVSVFADETCYHHIRRPDAGNAAFTHVQPASYFGYVRETLDVLDELAAPAAFASALLTRLLRTEMLQRLEGRRMLDYSDDLRQDMFAEIRKLLLERVPVEIESRLLARQRPLAAAVRGADLAAAVRHAQWQTRINVGAHMEDLRWEGDTLVLHWSARMTDPDGALVSGAPGRYVLAAYPDVAADLASVRVDCVARTRDRGREVLLPVMSDIQVDEQGGVVITGHAVLDFSTSRPGSLLTSGTWDLSAWVQAFGWEPEIRLAAGGKDATTKPCQPALTSRPSMLVRPHWTQRGNLSVQVDASPGSVGRDVRKAVGRVTRRGLLRPVLAVTLPLHVSEHQAVSVRLTPSGSDQHAPYAVTGRLEPDGQGSVLILRHPRLSRHGAVRLALLPADGRAMPLGVKVAARDGIATRLVRAALRRAKRAGSALRRRLRRGG